MWKIDNIIYQIRRDQFLKLMENNDIHATKALVCAPKWLRPILESFISNHFPSTSIQVIDRDGASKLLPSSSVAKFGLLKRLQVFSRNEKVNTSGQFNTKLYGSNALQNLGVIMSLRDLVRQTVIVSQATTTAFGGYNTQVQDQKELVLICDLPGLQFQDRYNTGRLVLRGLNRKLPEGLLDGVIFEHVVGERKTRALNLINNKRFVKIESKVFGGTVYFDTFAYKKFVSHDVVLAGLSLSKLTDKQLNFKFLKYGTGFFAGEFSIVIEAHILRGVLEGLDALLGKFNVKNIGQIELPFYTNTESNLVDSFQKKYRIKIVFSQADALKQEPNSSLITATTNCGDPHAVFGNEMGYSSVDAAIATNLEGNGRQFCPLLNEGMKGIYYDFVL